MLVSIAPPSGSPEKHNLPFEVIKQEETFVNSASSKQLSSNKRTHSEHKHVKRHLNPSLTIDHKHSSGALCCKHEETVTTAPKLLFVMQSLVEQSFRSIRDDTVPKGLDFLVAIDHAVDGHSPARKYFP
jgi:hypothetical protein